MARRTVLALACLAPIATGGEVDLVVGHPAPNHGIEDFAGSDRKKPGVVLRKIMSEGGTKVRRSSADLPDLRGEVVILHGFEWECLEAVGHTLPLLVHLLDSNEHRGLTIVGLVAVEPEEDREELRKRIAGHEIRWPVALVQGEATSPYLDVAWHGRNTVFVVGRSGALLWMGNPCGAEEEFLGVVAAELLRHAAPPLERDLDPALAKARQLYFAGDWEKARRAAEKLGKKHAKGKGPEAARIAADADYLITRVADHGADLLTRAREAMRKRHAFDFHEARIAIERGFRGTRLEKEVREVAKEAAKSLRGLHFGAIEDWFELRDEQPVLFPARKSREGGRFAKKLERYLVATSNTHPGTQLARRMLDEYAFAR